MEQCIGCAYNTRKYATGCEAFEVCPKNCMNYTTEEEKQNREHKITRYKECYTLSNILAPYRRWNWGL
jgi:hypothetical protein